MIDFSILLCIVMTAAQLWKKVGLNNDLIPLLNVLTAIVLSLIWKTELDLLIRIQQGLIIGLSASGVYDMYKCFKK